MSEQRFRVEGQGFDTFAEAVAAARATSKAQGARSVVIIQRVEDKWVPGRWRLQNCAAVQLGVLVNVYGHTPLERGPDGEDVSGL